MPVLGGPLLGALLFAALLSALLLFGLLRSRLAWRVLDHPNARSMHTRPTPRVGGLAMLAAFAVCALMWRVPLPGLLCVATGLLVTVSFVDDWRSLPVVVRLPLHMLVGALAVWSVAPSWPLAGLIFACLSLTWAINLYNFMDGLDGLAGGQAVFGFSAYALAAAHAGHGPMALASGALVGGALGFLVFNLHPARVFLGDAGSTGLGLLAGALGLWGAAEGLWPVWFPVVAFLPFMVDASLTLALRLLRRERVWEAHRQHAYQRLSLMGLGAPRTHLIYTLLMGLCAAAALLSLRHPAATLAALALTAAGYALVQQRWHRRRTDTRTHAC